MQSWLDNLDSELQSELQEIISNSKLSEMYLSLARDLDVMEPKLPDEVPILSIMPVPLVCTFQGSVLKLTFWPGLDLCVASQISLPLTCRLMSRQ